MISTIAAIARIVEIATKILAVVPIRTFVLVVRRHNSKFQANCALSDTSIRFSTLISVTNSNIFRSTAKLGVHWFPWKPKFIKSHEIPLFILLYQQLNTFISVVPNCEQVRHVLADVNLPLTTRCHGNDKITTCVENQKSFSSLR